MRVLFATVFALLCGCLYASDPVMVDLLKKAAEQEKLTEKKKKYNISEKPGFKIIGISEPYYIIDGVKVGCDDVEMKCSNGKCTLVPKKK
jgi:hypothetical protein